jgi:hypothetical protein
MANIIIIKPNRYDEHDFVYKDIPFKNYEGFRLPKLRKTFMVGKSYRYRLGFGFNYTKATLLRVYAEPVGNTKRIGNKKVDCQLVAEWSYAQWSNKDNNMKVKKHLSDAMDFEYNLGDD